MTSHDEPEPYRTERDQRETTVRTEEAKDMINKRLGTELVTMADIADRLGVARQTVYSWRKRAKAGGAQRVPMPEPDAFHAGFRYMVPLWQWATIRAWAEETGRL